MHVETHNAVDPVAREWEELADRTQAPPWVRPKWLSAWFDAFGQGALEIVALRRNGRLAAVLPLVRRRGAVASPTNWHSPDFRLVAEDADAKRALVEAVVSAGRRRVTLGFVDQFDAGLFRHASERRGYRLVERTLEKSPYLSIEGDHEAYERSLDRRVVSEARRRRRRLAEQGELTFQVEDGRQRLDQLLEEGFRVEASGWKGEAGTAIASREETRRFYTEVARFCAKADWLRLAFLRLDGWPIAFKFLVVHGRVFSQLKSGFDEEYRKFAPGILLLRDAIAQAFENGATTYEFLGADDPFKVEWASGRHERKVVQAFAPSLMGIVDRAAFTYARPVAKRARSLVRR